MDCPACGSSNIITGKKWCICDDCGERFSAAEKASDTMVFFFSYSHKEKEICQMVQEAFLQRGHKVWIDQEKIKEGDDWREKIAQGILSSNGVIAFLSRNSVRDPGVCLNELSIAVGVRGGNIKTVLLEREENVRPPSSISHLQWLDMSAWRTEQAKGEESFLVWFRKKMEKLIAVAESPETRAFTGEITTIRTELPLVVVDTSKQKSLLRQPFVGRLWLTREIEAWLDDREGASLCILYGDPGIGKSAFAANYCHYNSKVIASIFCEYNRVNFNRPQAIIQTLAYLLACRIPEYRKILVDVLDKTKNIGELDSSELFNTLLANPLGDLSIDGDHETQVIVIDGLDECGTYEQNSLAEVLGQYAGRLPGWLRILVTARRVDVVLNTLRGHTHFDLCGNAPDNAHDVQQYLEERLQSYHGREDYAQIIERLTEKSEGIFLYAKMVSESIIEGKLSLDSMTGFPDGISAAFYSWFGWFFPNINEYAAKFRLPMGLLAGTPEPLPVAEFRRVFAWGENDTDDFIRRIQPLVRLDQNEFQHETIVFSHKYIQDWLETEGAGRYRSRKNEALRQVGQRFWTIHQQKKKMTEYELLYLFDFLQKTDEETLSQLLQSTDVYLSINQIGSDLLRRGSIGRAWQYFEAGAKLAYSRLEKYPSLDARLICSISELWLAVIFKAQGNLKKIRELCESAYHTRKEICQVRGTLQDRKCFALSCERLADSCEDYGDSGRRKELLQEEKDTLEKMIAEEENPEFYRNLGSAYLKLAEIHEFDGDYEAASAMIEKMMHARKKQIEKRNNEDDVKDYVVALMRKATYLWHVGMVKQAEEVIALLLTYEDTLIRQKDNLELRSTISDYYRTLSRFADVKGDYEETEMYLRKSIQANREMVSRRGSKADYYSLGTGYYRLARLMDDLHEYAKAEPALLMLLDIDEMLVKERGRQEDLTGLLLCYYFLAMTEAKLGKKEQAMDCFQKAEPFYRQAFGQRFASIRNQMDFARLANWANAAYDALGNQEKAEEFCEQSLEIGRKLMENGPQMKARQYYAGSLLIKAYSYQDRCEWLEANQMFQEAIALDQQNAEEAGRPQDREYLAEAMAAYAGCLFRQRDYPQAALYAARAYDIASQLCSLREVKKWRDIQENAKSILEKSKAASM